MIGVNTRQALRAWQKAKGLPADGHLTQALSQQLRAEAGPLAPAAPPRAAADGPPAASGAPAAPTAATPGSATPHKALTPMLRSQIRTLIACFRSSASAFCSARCSAPT
ncbi:MAG: peptidoglycan-binding domain-containing protein [Caulobacteraceae bacterium]